MPAVVEVAVVQVVVVRVTVKSQEKEEGQFDLVCHLSHLLLQWLH